MSQEKGRRSRRRSFVICTVDKETGELDPVGRTARLMVWRLRKETRERARTFAMFVVPMLLIAGIGSCAACGVGAFSESASATPSVERRVKRASVAEETATVVIAAAPVRTLPASYIRADTEEVVARFEVVRIGAWYVSYRHGNGEIELKQEAVYETRPVGAVSSGSSASSRGKVNLNTATPDELDRLPGVGPAMISRIIAHRPFRNVRALDDVPGIGPARYAEIEPLVTVN